MVCDNLLIFLQNFKVFTKCSKNEENRQCNKSRCALKIFFFQVGKIWLEDQSMMNIVKENRRSSLVNELYIKICTRSLFS